MVGGGEGGEGEKHISTCQYRLIFYLVANVATSYIIQLLILIEHTHLTCTLTHARIHTHTHTLQPM